ncbi:MAG: ThiF family adenylyltransferase [Anaerolineae bacterium]|nr:ThiF family adenylyltransferase [Anaerolineae bacterium]
MLDATRQLDILPPEKLGSRHVDVIGVGSIGSWFSMILGKTVGGQPDFTVRLWDGDRLEPINLCSQLYEVSQQGELKVEAMQHLLASFAGVKSEVKPVYLDGSPSRMLKDIVVVATDSITSRQMIWENHIADNPDITWLADARMGAEKGTILFIQPQNLAHRDFYELGLFPEEQASPAPCTARAVSYNCSFVASLVMRNIACLLRDQPVFRRIDYDLEDFTFMVID